MRKIGAAVNN